ncbi:MAG TPA: hypothetical protein VGE45_03230 [Chloroflexia bacterium]
MAPYRNRRSERELPQAGYAALPIRWNEVLGTCKPTGRPKNDASVRTGSVKSAHVASLLIVEAVAAFSWG